MLELLLRQTRVPGGAVLAGPAGIGKSRLLDEALVRCKPSSSAIHRVVATAATTSVPFGAVFPMVRSGDFTDRTAVLGDLRRRLIDDAGPRRLVVGVDDAHLLDQWSLALLACLVHHDGATLVCTGRNDEPWPPTLTALWTGGALRRIDVGPLADADIAEMAQHVLGGEIAPDLAATFAELSGGNPLLLRELVLDSRASGTISVVGDRWQADAPLRPGPRLHDLVGDRLRRLSDGERSVLELVSVGEPLDIVLLDTAEGRELDALELAGFVAVEAHDGRVDARSGHPLIGAAVREAMPTRRWVAVHHDLVQRVVRCDPPRPGEALHAARRALPVGDLLPAPLARLAAREALSVFDLDLAADLAEQTLVAGADFEAWLVLGEARRLQARSLDAERALDRATALADSDDRRVRCARLTSLLLAHQLGRPVEAVALLEATIASVGEEHALPLRSMVQGLSGMLGGYPEVLEASRRTLGDDGLDDGAVLDALSNLTFAQAMLGRLDGFEGHLERALQLADRSPTPIAEIIDLLWALRAGVYVQRGELVEGERVIGEHIERVRAAGGRWSTTATIFLQLLLHRASPRLFALGDDVLEDLAAFDPFGVSPIALSSIAHGHALCGDPDSARRLLDQIPDDLADDRALPFVGAARAAVHEADHDPEGCAATALAAGRRGIETTYTAFGLVAMHVGVGSGTDATVAADQMHAAAAQVDGALLQVMADHAIAWRDRDAKDLEAVGSSFADLGAPGLAARALAHAAMVHDPDSVGARRAAARSRAWSRAAEPFLVPVPSVPDALSAREQDVAVLAALGQPSRRIAERLFLSVRTVDNHLRQVYRKLEASGRPALSEVLSPVPPPG